MCPMYFNCMENTGDTLYEYKTGHFPSLYFIWSKYCNLPNQSAGRFEEELGRKIKSPEN